MTVALGEQDPAQRHALAGRAQAHFAELLLDVVPGAAGTVGAARRGRQLERRPVEPGGKRTRWRRLSHWRYPLPRKGPARLLQVKSLYATLRPLQLSRQCATGMACPPKPPDAGAALPHIAPIC